MHTYLGLIQSRDTVVSRDEFTTYMYSVASWYTIWSNL